MSRPRKRVLIVVLLLIAVWIVVAAAYLALGLAEASHGVAQVSVAQEHLSASDIVSQEALPPLRAARDDFRSSSSKLDSFLLAPLKVVPVVGRQLTSAQDLASAAATVSQVGVAAVQQAGGILQTPHPSGPQRVQTLGRLVDLAQGTEKSLAGVDLGPSNALFSPLASKRTQFISKLDQAETKLQHASQVGAAMKGILQGPTTYLLLMANNAEMRAGSGAFLELGLMSSQNGHVQLSDMVPSASLNLSPGTVQVSGDLESRWGWLMPGVDWRNLGFTPQFGVNGPLAAQMYAAATGQHVDGVLAIDVIALQQLLEVTGPVTLPNGDVIGASNAVAYLTHDQYAGLTDQSPASGQEARQDQLGAIAHGVVSALDSQSVDLKSLADAMTTVTEGRHLMVWSSDVQAQRAWSNSGVAGGLTKDSTLVSVINRGGNKLDQYVYVSVRLQLVRHGSLEQASLSVNVENHTPSGQAQYIGGPYPGLNTAYGEYVGVLAVNFPAAASDIRMEGGEPLVAAGAEGPTWLLARNIDLMQGTASQFDFTFNLPSSGSLEVMPAARLQPVIWHFSGGSATDIGPFWVRW